MTRPFAADTARPYESTTSVRGARAVAASPGAAAWPSESGQRRRATVTRAARTPLPTARRPHTTCRHGSSCITVHGVPGRPLAMILIS